MQPVIDAVTKAFHLKKHKSVTDRSAPNMIIHLLSARVCTRLSRCQVYRCGRQGARERAVSRHQGTSTVFEVCLRPLTQVLLGSDTQLYFLDCYRLLPADISFTTSGAPAAVMPSLKRCCMVIKRFMCWQTSTPCCDTEL